MHARIERGEIAGLRQIIRGADFKAPAPVSFVISGRQEQKRNHAGRRIGAETPAQCVSVHPRKRTMYHQFKNVGPIRFTMVWN